MYGALSEALPVQRHCRQCHSVDLGHTATSVLSATGVAPTLVADLLVHVDTRMVFRHYRHPVTPAIDIAAEHIERAIKA